MKLEGIPRKIISRIREQLGEPVYRSLSSTYDINGYKRMYLIHIRKTGGTSLHKIFLSLAVDDPDTFYETLAQTPGHRLARDGKVFVGWNPRLINKGHYFYGFSHAPLYTLDLPPETFTITCFRDPVRRLVSHYNMLIHYSLNRIQHLCMATEGAWLGDSFDDFLDRIPQEHLMNQLYMFSARFDVDQAVERVGGLSHVLFTEHFEEGLQELREKTGLPLGTMHSHKSNYSSRISDRSLARAREMLDKEYTFMRQIREIWVPETQGTPFAYHEA